MAATDETPFHITSDILNPVFKLLPWGRAELNDVPIYPGGHLEGRFTFTSEIMGEDGAHLRPDFALAWTISRGSKPEDSVFGGDGTACAAEVAPYMAKSRVAIASFDETTGHGVAQFDVPMLVGCDDGPPAFAGKNKLTLHLGTSGVMKRECDGAPNAWAHQFAPLKLHGRIPALSVNLHTLKLGLEQNCEVTVIRAGPSKRDEDLRIEVEAMPGSDSKGPPSGLQCPSFVRLPKGENAVTFRIAFTGPHSGSGGLVRLHATDGSGVRGVSAPLTLLGMAEAPPGFTPKVPLESTTEWFKKCTKNVAAFNLPPGAVWVDVGPCDTNWVGVGPPVPAPPVAGGPVLLYTPSECTYAMDTCVVFPIVLNGTLYNKLTIQVACTVRRFVGPRPGFWVNWPGIRTITIYTAIGPGRAIVDDCT